MRGKTLFAGAVLLLVLAVAPVTVSAAATTQHVDSAATGANATANGTAAAETTVTILSYNDIQTAASSPETMGRLVGAINDRRAAHDNPTFVVGGGDQVSPSSLSPVSNWTVPVRTLNVLQPDAEVVGNHDLDYGFGPVANFSAASEFPWLLANVVTEDGDTVPGTENYTIVERGGVRVGVVGLVDGAIEAKTAVDFEAAGYEVADFSTVGSRIATDLKANHDVDVVVAAAHIGIPESKELANETENIDVVVSGDDEAYYPPQVTGGAVITEAEAGGAFVGELNLTVDGDSVEMDSGRLLEIGENVTMNETARTLVNESRGKFLSTVAGETTVELDSTFGNYNEETRWGNLVTDAFRAQTGAQVAATNSGGIRGNFVFGPGPVTYDDIYTSLPFGNTLVTKEMTGEQLTEFLESQVTTLESEDGQRYGEQMGLQVSGVTYEYVPHENATDLVRDVHVNGVPVSENATYTVTVNSYMAGWTMYDYNWSMADLPTVSENLMLYGTAAVEYIENNTPVSPAVDGHVQRVDATAAATTGADADRVTVTVEAPEDHAGLNGSVFLTAPGQERVTTESVTDDHDNGTIMATFDRDAVASLATDYGSTVLELYAEYDSSAYDLVYHDHARMNAAVAVDAVGPTLDGADAPAGSVDADPRLEDIDGDGGIDVFDALTYYNNRDTATVQRNPVAFDYDGDGTAGTVFDALALYNDAN